MPAFNNPPRPPRGERALPLRLAPALLLVLALALTAGLTLFVRYDQDRTDAARMDIVTAHVIGEMEQRLLALEQVLRVAAGSLAVKPDFSENDWATFVDHLALDAFVFRGTTGLGFAVRVDAADAPAFVARQRLARPDFDIWPASAREVHFPIVRLKGVEIRRTKPPIGLDLLSEPIRRDALDRAARSGDVSYSLPTLANIVDPSGHRVKDSELSVMMYAPVWHGGRKPGDGARRDLNALSGAVLARLRLPVLLRATTADSGGVALTLTLPGPDRKPLVVDSHPGVQRLAGVAGRTRTLHRGGLDLEFTVQPLPEWRDPGARATALQVAVFGVAGSLALFCSLFWVERRRSRELAGMAAQVGQSESRFRDIADAAPFIIWLSDTALRTTYVNSAWTQSTGVPVKDALGGRWLELVHHDDLPGMRALGAELLGSPRSFTHNCRMRHGDGSYRWHILQGRPLPDAYGTITGFMGMSMDIHELKTAEAEREANLGFMTDLINAVPMPVSVKDEQLRFVIANDALAAWLGRSREEICGRTDFDLFTAGDAEIHRARDQAVMATDGPMRFDVRYRPLGSDREMLAHIAKVALRRPDGSVFVLTSIMDMTQHRQMERKLREREAILRAIVWTSGVAAWSWEVRTDTYELSPQVAEQLGYAQGELERSAQAWFGRIHPADLTGVRGTVRTAIVGDASVLESEYRIRHKDGTWRSLLSRGVIERDDAGRVVRIHGGNLDVTEFRRAQEALRRHRDDLERLVSQRTAELTRAKESAESADRTKSEFLANMSHELRTPMHAVLSFSRLGLDRTASPGTRLEKLADYFDRINQSGHRLLSLLNDLLDLSKLEAGRMNYDFALHPLENILDLVRNEFSALANDRDVRIEARLEQPDVVAWCDAARIAQVVRNLLSNALKFTPRGSSVSVVIGTGSLPDVGGAQRRAATLQVMDQGIGIPPDEFEQVFDKFIQSSRTKSGAGGTGLGLTICRQIVDQHGGMLWAGNNAGGGACFTMMLPSEARTQPDPQDTAPGQVQTPARHAMADVG